jgi:anaerobic dimethyl sulfoxide reductase subunit B (iron-sulfur subunit)
MIKQLGFYIIAGRCVQCYACEVACKEMNNVALGLRWRKVRDRWGGEYPHVTHINMSTACMHCADPACAAVCPPHAITKRAEDGIVVVNASECIGCRSCESACPYGAPQYGHDGKMQKCDLCLDQLKQAKQPACVATCPGEALGFGAMEELTKLAESKGGKALPGDTRPSFVIVPGNGDARPSVYFDAFFRS